MSGYESLQDKQSYFVTNRHFVPQKYNGSLLIVKCVLFVLNS